MIENLNVSRDSHLRSATPIVAVGTNQDVNLLLGSIRKSLNFTNYNRIRVP